MPVKRYRDVADVPPPDATDPREPATLARVLAHLEAMTGGLPPLFEPGVRRYASIEAAQVDRERATIDRMRRRRAGREREGA